MSILGFFLTTPLAVSYGFVPSFQASAKHALLLFPGEKAELNWQVTAATVSPPCSVPKGQCPPPAIKVCSQECEPLQLPINTVLLREDKR